MLFTEIDSVEYLRKDSKSYTTWRKLLDIAREDEEIIECTMSDKSLDKEFCDHNVRSYVAFTAWSENYVYFPAIYDGYARVAKATRNPNSEVVIAV